MEAEELQLPEVALSLWQPYTWLVAHGHKPIENRTKNFSQKKFRGPFWIHAGLFKSPEVWQDVRVLCDEFLGKEFRLPPLDELAFGAIIGRAVITGIIPPLGGVFSPTKPVPWHFRDQYGFVVEGAVPLKEPISCRGARGFFRPPAEVQAELRKAAAA